MKVVELASVDMNSFDDEKDWATGEVMRMWEGCEESGRNRDSEGR